MFNRKKSHQQQQKGSNPEAKVVQKVKLSIMVSDFNFQKKMQMLKPNGSNYWINFHSDK